MKIKPESNKITVLQQKKSKLIGENTYHEQYYFIQKIQMKMSSQCYTMI